MGNMKVWITAEGERIRIKEMTTFHLNNTIAFLERRAAQEKDNMLTSLYFADSIVSGEAAQDSIDSMVRQLENNPDDYAQFLPAIYEDMIDERDRRIVEQDMTIHKNSNFWEKILRGVLPIIFFLLQRKST